jgi:hypothetical protein
MAGQLGRASAMAVLAVALTAPAALAAPPLTEAEVDRVIAASRDLTPVVKQHKSAWSELGRAQAGKADAQKDPCKPSPEVRKAPGYAEAETVVKRHGFADGEAYCRTSMRVFATCGVIKADKEHPSWRAEAGNREQKLAEAQQQMAKALKQLDASPNLSPEQKAQLRQQMTSMLESTRQMGRNPMLGLMDDVTDADKTVAGPRCGELETVGKEMADE